MPTTLAASSAAYAEPKSDLPQSAVPEYLIREVIDGLPFYYKGYKNVLSGIQTPEEIMGSSGIQSLLVTYLTLALGTVLDKKKYWLLASEVGGHLDKNNNLSFDFAIFDKAVVKPQDFDLHYLKFAPKIAIEVDTDVDISEGELPEHEYIFRKTSNLLRFGTEKIIWVFTRTQQVMVVTGLNDWHTCSWDQNIEVLDGATFNIADYIEEEGINLQAMLRKR